MTSSAERSSSPWRAGRACRLDAAQEAYGLAIRAPDASKKDVPRGSAILRALRDLGRRELLRHAKRRCWETVSRKERSNTGADVSAPAAMIFCRSARHRRVVSASWRAYP
jgi:hypothetical protein